MVTSSISHPHAISCLCLPVNYWIFCRWTSGLFFFLVGIPGMPSRDLRKVRSQWCKALSMCCALSSSEVSGVTHVLKVKHILMQFCYKLCIRHLAFLLCSSELEVSEIAMWMTLHCWSRWYSVEYFLGTSTGWPWHCVLGLLVTDTILFLNPMTSVLPHNLVLLGSKNGWFCEMCVENFMFLAPSN